jgi:hypothetical protein
MLIVVDPHRLLIDVRFQRFIIVWEGGEGECHDQLLR